MIQESNKFIVKNTMLLPTCNEDEVTQVFCKCSGKCDKNNILNVTFFFVMLVLTFPTSNCTYYYCCGDYFSKTLKFHNVHINNERKNPKLILYVYIYFMNDIERVLNILKEIEL